MKAWQLLAYGVACIVAVFLLIWGITVLAQRAQARDTYKCTETSATTFTCIKH